ncbi:MAG: hypothetical protein OEX07_15465, partial [Gammaproteobacteria bacterium]|nr:hypothetical protein [Gammaproteobacteria bacterium]
MNISIRLLVAYIMLCFAAAQSISQILVFSLNTKDELITKEQQYLAQYMSIAQSSINFFSAQNDIQGINNQLGALITTHNISEAILIDTEHNIIASADRTHIHKFVADVLPNLSDKTIKKTARTLQGEIQNIKECNCFISTYPVTQKDSNKITPTEQNILIVKYSYDLALQTAYYDTEQTLILNLIFIIFVTALLWISFHRVITAKINQLVGITENIAKGNLSTRTNIVGNNELG